MYNTQKSASTDKWIAIFNSKFEEFVKDLIVIFPEDKDFKLLGNSFRLMKLADHRKPFELFAMYGGKFEKFVETKDENFFLNHSYDDVVKSESNFTEDLVNKLKSYWSNMTDIDKESTWTYLQLFFRLKNKISTP
jgi:hypothetical protein